MNRRWYVSITDRDPESPGVTLRCRSTASTFHFPHYVETQTPVQPCIGSIVLYLCGFCRWARITRPRACSRFSTPLLRWRGEGLPSRQRRLRCDRSALCRRLLALRGRPRRTSAISAGGRRNPRPTPRGRRGAGRGRAAPRAPLPSRTQARQRRRPAPGGGGGGRRRTTLPSMHVRGVAGRVAGRVAGQGGAGAGCRRGARHGGGRGGLARPPGRPGAGARRQQGDPAEEHQAAGGGAAHRLGAARRRRRRRLPQVRMRRGGAGPGACGGGGCAQPGAEAARRGGSPSPGRRCRGERRLPAASCRGGPPFPAGFPVTGSEAWRRSPGWSTARRLASAGAARWPRWSRSFGFAHEAGVW